MKSLLLLLALACGVSGCTSLLPRSSTESTGFESFNHVQASVESLVPMKSRRSDLEVLGLGTRAQPNSKLLTHADVVRLVIPAGVLRREDLDPGILVCTQARDTCRGMQIDIAKIHRKRMGNFFSDFANFKRTTHTTGWKFNALVLFVDDLVVYRSWGGQSDIREVEVSTNPLGPLQDLGPSLITSK